MDIKIEKDFYVLLLLMNINRYKSKAFHDFFKDESFAYKLN